MKIVDKYGNIYLIEKKEGNTARELKETFPDCKICVCDFYITDSENGKLAKNGAMSFEDLLIIDHHAALPEMMRHVSSTTFANQYVLEHGPLDESYAVVINHTDTDALLSALIMAGILEPLDDFNAAAIAADHTGEENIISDVLQVLDKDNCLQKSVDVLLKLLERRLWLRQELRILAENHEFEMNGGVAYKLLEKPIDDAGLLPCFFPNADAIIVAWPMPNGNGKWGIKTRLGVKTEGVSLLKMNLPDTGGRWDAVSTTRHGGTDTPPEEYVKLVMNGIKAARKENDGN
jgi:hypothetical protein